MRTLRCLSGVLAGSVAVAALLSPKGAAAQETIELGQVTVEEQGQPAGAAAGSGVGPVNGVVAKATRTGSKSATPIKDIPQSVSVVGRTEIDDQGAQKVDEALRYTAGVFTQPFGADSDTNWLFIRGFQATATGAYMDDLQLFSYAFGGFYIDSFGLERVEVLKGPASVLYGGSNPGGIVNYVSKRPTGERLRYVETGINDAGTAYGGFDIGDAADETWSYRVNGRVLGGNGYSDFQDGWRGIISPSLTWSPDAATSLTVLANVTRVDETHNGGSFLPYEGTVVDRTLGGVNYGRIDRDANFTEPDVDEYDRTQGSIGYEFEHSFDNGWTARSKARVIGASVEEVSIYPNGWASATELDRINFGHDTDALSYLSDQQIEGKVETGPVEHTILAGVDYKYYNIDQVQESAIFGTTPSIDGFDPVYGVPLTERVPYLSQDLTQRQLGLYVQDQLRFGDGWLVTLNGRYDYSWLKADNRPDYYSDLFGTPVVDLDREEGRLSGRAGLAYDFAGGLTPYASVATFFNPIIGTDANGDLFQPEEGVQYEAGLKYQPTAFDGLLTFSVFDLTRRNVPSNVTAFAQLQTGAVRSRGFEFEGKVNVTPDLKLTGAITAYNIEITEDEDATLIGKTPFIVPEVLASASVDYTFRGEGWYDGLSLGAGVRYQGRSFADNQNTLEVPSATLADLKVGYSRGDSWGVDLNVTNAFDKKYVSSCQGAAVCSYGEGRAFKLKARATW